MLDYEPARMVSCIYACRVAEIISASGSRNKISYASTNTSLFFYSINICADIQLSHSQKHRLLCVYFCFSSYSECMPWMENGGVELLFYVLPYIHTYFQFCISVNSNGVNKCPLVFYQWTFLCAAQLFRISYGHAFYSTVEIWLYFYIGSCRTGKQRIEFFFVFSTKRLKCGTMKG